MGEGSDVAGDELPRELVAERFPSFKAVQNEESRARIAARERLDRLLTLDAELRDDSPAVTDELARRRAAATDRTNRRLAN